MAFDTTASLDAARQAYYDNADYLEQNSSAKCRSFITATIRLLSLIPSVSGTRDSRVEFEPETLRKELTDAKAWLASNNTAATSSNYTTRADLRNSRD